MTMTRRKFLLTSAGIVASSILVNAVTRVFFGEHRDRLEPRADDVILKIDGWDSGGDDPYVAWIAVGPSWRSAWR
jgi:hypothetical protein